MFVKYNSNPIALTVDDCAIRALAKAIDVDWETAYTMLAANGFAMGNIPTSKAVVNATLRQHGFYRYIIPDSCPYCYTAKDFCFDHPDGIYVLAFDSHIATVKDGMIYDTWNSSDEIPLFYWTKNKEE